MNETLAHIQRAIDFVEAHLSDELPLALIAGRARSSPWHFHRLFGALTGETPAGYVAKRRLGEACRRLVETDQPIADLAQATFTRAFTQRVGVSPGRFRRTRPPTAAHRYPPLDLAALTERERRSDTMEPRIVRKAAFHVIGMAGRYTPSTTTRIPELWARFAPRLHDVPRRAGTHTLGVCIDADPAATDGPSFTYVAAVEVSAIDDVPDGMLALTIPANSYAVFTHTGHISRIGDTVKQVWGHWLPASRYQHVAAPDFELYDARWNPMTGEGDVDLYVPIADT